MDTAPQTRPSHSLTFEQACEIVAGPMDRAARWEALKLKHGVGMTGASFAETSPEEALAEKWDRYNEPGERYDDGFDVERWAGAGR